MKAWATAVLGLVLACQVSATALTALLNANERSCYYADVDGVGEKVGTCQRIPPTGLYHLWLNCAQASTLPCSPEDPSRWTML